MIRYLVFINLLTLFSSSWLMAQHLTFEGGILAGINRADFKGEKEEFWYDDYDRSAVSGISAGAFVKCNLNEDSYGLLELRYIRKGCRYGYINKIFTQSFESVTLDYVELPLLYGINSVFHGKSGDIKFAFEGGLAFARLFSSRLKYDQSMRREVTASMDGFRNYDISWIARIKIPYGSGKKHRFLWGIRIENSLISINRDYRLHNFNVGLEMNYMFNKFL